MRFAMHGPRGAERPAMLDSNGGIRDFSGLCAGIAGPALSGLGRFEALDIDGLPLVVGDPRLGACVGGTGKFMCIGLNYADHAAEAGLEVPPEPVLSMKATSAICGPEIPSSSRVAPKGPTGKSSFAWSTENPRNVSARPMRWTTSPVAAWSMTIRNVNGRPGVWAGGPEAMVATISAPVGPWLVAPDEVAGPWVPRLWLSVNGETVQDGSTEKTIYGVLRGMPPVVIHDLASGRYHLGRHTAPRGRRISSDTFPQGREHRRIGRRRPRPITPGGGRRSCKWLMPNPCLHCLMARAASCLAGQRHLKRLSGSMGFQSDLAGSFPRKWSLSRMAWRRARARRRRGRTLAQRRSPGWDKMTMAGASVTTSPQQAWTVQACDCSPALAHRLAPSLSMAGGRLFPFSMPDCRTIPAGSPWNWSKAPTLSRSMFAGQRVRPGLTQRGTQASPRFWMPIPDSEGRSWTSPGAPHMSLSPSRRRGSPPALSATKGRLIGLTTSWIVSLELRRVPRVASGWTAARCSRRSLSRRLYVGACPRCRPPECSTIANATATIKCQTFGGRQGAPDRDELMRTLQGTAK